MSLSNSIESAGACFLLYSQSGNSLWLVNDTGTQWTGGYAPGTANTLSNSQCSVNAASVSVSGFSNTLVLKVPVTFYSPAFIGPQSVNAEVTDRGGGSSGYQLMGSWTTYAASSQLPSALAPQPSAGTGMGQSFTFHASDVNGYRYIPAMDVIFNSSLNTVNACYFAYDRAAGWVGLADNNATTFGTGGTLGSSTVLSSNNSQCSINLAQSTAYGSGNDLYLTLSITFTSTFAGAKNVYEQVYDHTAQNTGWVPVGTWTVAAVTTITSAPPGLSMTVDGVACTSPCVFAWTPGSSHTIATTSPQAGATGTQYVYASWSDAGAQSHSITVPSSGATYTASFNTQYYLTTTASPSAGGSTTPASGWNNSGSVVTVNESTNSGYQFTGFSGAVSGTTRPQNLTVSGPASVSANFSVPALTIATTALPNGTTGLFYSFTLSASGGVSPYSWSLVGTQNVTGLTVSQGGVLSGTPSSQSSYNTVTVTVRDSAGTSVGPQTFSLTLTQGGGPLSANCAVSPSAPTPGQTVTFTADPSGGSGSYTYSWSGAVSGTAQSEQIINAAAGPYSATVTVTDSQSHQYQAYCSVTVQAATLTITTAPPLPDGSVNVTYSQPLSATGGMGVYTWSLTSGSLPPGVTLSQTSGVVSGTPTTDGLYGFILTVVDAGGHSASQNSSLRITVIRITTTSLQSGQAGSYYSQQLSATGGIGCCTWSVVGAPTLTPTLATPAVYLSAGGLLSGYPAVATTSSFTVRATDQRGNYANATLSLTAIPNGSTITGPSALQMNLSFMPFDLYDSTDSAAYPYGFMQSCPAGSSVRLCFNTILSNLRAQGVSGVRIYVDLCGGSKSTPLSGCATHTYSGPSPSTCSVPTDSPSASWICKVALFFQDVKAAGIQNISITLAASDGVVFSLPKAQTTSPLGSGLGTYCNDTPDPVYFFPSEPYGLQPPPSYPPIGKDEPNSGGYNCAPINPYFVGWQTKFNVVDAMLAAAASTGLTVYELEPEQELFLADFPVVARHIVDNSNPAAPFDVMSGFQMLMQNHGFLPGRVTYSATHDNSTLGDYDCGDVFGDYARNMGLDQVAAAINGNSYIGLPGDPSSHPFLQDATTGWLPCGGAATSDDGTVHYMRQGLPLGHTSQPTIVDVHMYPCVWAVQGGPQCFSTDTAAAAQSEAKIDFNDLLYYFQNILHLPSTTPLLLGETHSNSSNGQGPAYTCEQIGLPASGTVPSSAAESVAGYNQSSFPASGLSVVFRPWMTLQYDPLPSNNPDTNCFSYANPDNQLVNGQSDANGNLVSSGTGPYTPTQQ